MSIAHAFRRCSATDVCNRVAHASYTANTCSRSGRHQQLRGLLVLAVRPVFTVGCVLSQQQPVALRSTVAAHSGGLLEGFCLYKLPVQVTQQGNSDAKGVCGSRLGGLQEGTRARETVAQLVPELRRGERLHREGCVPQLAAVVPLHTAHKQSHSTLCNAVEMIMPLCIAIVSGDTD